MQNDFWENKKVFLTGHTGFKGSWFSFILQSFGAKVHGYALAPDKNHTLFSDLNIENKIESSSLEDIRNFDCLSKKINDIQPEIVFHLAAQPLVRNSYDDPRETYDINVMGTLNLLESLKKIQSVKAVVIVTTDKCYENREWVYPYRETDSLGGYDPYSSSKACVEILVSSYRRSFFNEKTSHSPRIATARAGNVIGGGDWAKDRLVPDIIRSLMANKKVFIRYPDSVRPWQHVFESLQGYLRLAEKLYHNSGYETAWNFGPNSEDAKPVRWIVDKVCQFWGKENILETDSNNNPHEAHFLKLDWEKAKHLLNWSPKWNIEQALDKTVEFYKAYQEKLVLEEIARKQIKEFYNEYTS